MTVDIGSIHRAARAALGHRSLLPGQQEAIAALIDGRDTLALLPTGGGKSAIYQVAGEIITGPTVVVSPLIALQHDQLHRLLDAGLSAAALNSTMSAGERRAVIEDFEAGRLEFLLLAPEQLADGGTIERLRGGRPTLFVVDEAHCVVEWGSDFRPEYRRLGAVAEALGRPPVLGLTATASPLLRGEIVERLGLRDPVVVARGFDRPNIDLAVEHHADREAKRVALVACVAELDPPGIVYAAARRSTLEIAEMLRAGGIRAEAYHAGLGARQRARVQDAFMADDVDVIVATIAFGMGIDKPDVRFVVHHDISESLDAYHQEIGRAGRDDEPARAILFHRAEDLGLRRFQAAPARFDEREVGRVVRALRSTGGGSAAALASSAGLSRRKADAIVGRLEELGTVRVDASGHATIPDGAETDAGPAAHEAVARQERRRAVERSRVEMVRGYAETTGCRRAFLLGYFGEPFEPPCGRCDRCRAGTGEAATSAPEDRDDGFQVSDTVRHLTFGRGVVTAVEPGRLTVAFEDVGYRVLDTAEATGRDLLRREA